jgi:hypothetical protein
MTRPPTPWLDLWRRKMREEPGIRGRLDRPHTWLTDSLWEAACWERRALLAFEQGCGPKTIEHDLKEAQRIAEQAKLTASAAADGRIGGRADSAPADRTPAVPRQWGAPVPRFRLEGWTR